MASLNELFFLATLLPQNTKKMLILINTWTCSSAWVNQHYIRGGCGVGQSADPLFSVKFSSMSQEIRSRDRSFEFRQTAPPCYIINHSFCVLIQETKEDRHRRLNPKLLFPLKAWLRGFLPGHKFTWEEEIYCDETDIDENKVITVQEFQRYNIRVYFFR